MTKEIIDTLIVGGGQAGLAMSAHLAQNNIPHLVLERARIAERWRVDRWASLVANGPAWHDRFPVKEFADCGPDDFPSRDEVVAYFEQFAAEQDVPIRTGVEVTRAVRTADGTAFEVETTHGAYRARNIVAATGPFQKPAIPPVVPTRPGLTQIHSTAYDRPEALPEGAVLVVGAGSSGSQIAEELNAGGRDVYLSIGAHDRPPRRYRGKDFVWWLGVLGKWEMKSPPVGAEHVTIAVSGAHGGQTVDFRRFAADGITLMGMTEDFRDGVVTFAGDLARNIREGDANYLSVLKEADAYIAREGLDFPPEPEAHRIAPDPDCVLNPIRALDLEEKGISTIIWATGFTQDFSWLQVDAFDETGKPAHCDGVSTQEGVYFLGLPWLSMRGSSFIWGVWVDAGNIAADIAAKGRRLE